MVLAYPAFLSDFYKPILEFVSFDMIPTSTIYEKIFGWQSSAYSDQAESLGYES